MLSVGSLFSGIGGFDLGLERAGMRTAWFCEQDEFCQRVLAKHWPGVPCYSDITELRAADVEPVDVLCGGFPCQDLSWAGPGAGLSGARSGLWSEYARLIGELGPRYVLVENVSALLARGLGTVLGDLAALGYDAEWDCIPASAVGAPHRRDRIWLVAYPHGEGEHVGAVDAEVGGAPQSLADAGGERRQWRAGEQGTRRPAPLGDQASGDAGNGCRSRLPAADSTGARLEGSGIRGRPAVHGPAVGHTDQERRDGRTGQLGPGGRGEPADPGWWLVEPDVGRVAHGVPARVDRLRSLGNALVPQIAEWIGRRIVEYESQHQNEARVA